jgi:glycosyltransferase involved in cell wall biosynthesis
MRPLSVIIPCKNEQQNIGDCIRALQVLADEIIIADNGSTDATLQIVAQIGGCRVIEREFIGYASFKNWALPQAKNDWVLMVDADERLTPELAAEIRTLLSGDPACDAYGVSFDNYFLGHPIRYCGWNTPEVTRLLRKSVCRYRDVQVHESIEVSTGKLGSLCHRFQHYTARDLETYVRKVIRYGCLDGNYRYERGKRPNYLFTLLHAPLRFLQLFVLRGGFRDGFPGLVLCIILAFYVFMKDARLWERSDPVAAAQPGDPNLTQAKSTQPAQLAIAQRAA